MTDAIEEMARRADIGDPAAMTAIGKLALVGRAGNRTPNDGTRLLVKAAEAGNAEADAVIAVLIGADAKAIADWELALGYLERAAWRGWVPARRQLALLCRDQNLAAQSAMESPPAKIWNSMRCRVDVPALTSVPDGRAVFEQPHVRVIEGFATPAECSWMIERARPRMARARVFDNDRGGSRLQGARTNSAVQFDILEADIVLLILHARIAAATGYPTNHLEETNVLHYAAGEEFVRHHDYFDPGRPGLAKEIAEAGQRAVTFLVYLNEGFDGGETRLLKLDWQFRGRPGDALCFRNILPSGEPDVLTLHAGLPPLRGEKWLLSQWIRTRPPRRSSVA
ncbi:MAG TPA: 2OG-Fe(II) oxygenase [Rhizomicrobium sp.]